MNRIINTSPITGCLWWDALLLGSHWFSPRAVCILLFLVLCTCVCVCFLSSLCCFLSAYFSDSFVLWCTSHCFFIVVWHRMKFFLFSRFSCCVLNDICIILTFDICVNLIFNFTNLPQSPYKFCPSTFFLDVGVNWLSQRNKYVYVFTINYQTLQCGSMLWCFQSLYLRLCLAWLCFNSNPSPGYGVLLGWDSICISLQK